MKILENIILQYTATYTSVLKFHLHAISFLKLVQLQYVYYIQGVPKKTWKNDLPDQSYNKNQKSHRNMGSQTPSVGARGH